MKQYNYPVIFMMLLLLAGGVTSCKVGKGYERPQMETPDSIWSKQSYLSIADMKWWQMYTDGPLRSLIQKTIEQNKDLGIAAAKVKELAAQKRVNTADLFPQVSTLIDGQREFEHYNNQDKDYDTTFDAKLLLSWEVDLWGRLRWGRQAAIADYLSTVEAQHALRTTIIAQVVQAYYELIALDNELSIVRQTLKAREEGVRIARLRFHGGLTTESPYQQAQLEVARTATMVPSLEQKIALKENEIAFLAGEFPHHVKRSSLLQEFNYTTMLPVGLSSDLMERRPDIRQAEQQLISAHAMVGASFTNMFPKLTLTAQYGLENDELSGFLESPWALLRGALVTPIFSAGKNRAAWKAKKAAYEQAHLSYEKVVINAFKEVQNAIVTYNKVREMCLLQRRLERAAHGHVELVQTQYINGAVNYLDVLDAQRVYFDAQIALSNSIRDELTSVVQLYKALGGGW